MGNNKIFEEDGLRSLPEEYLFRIRKSILEPEICLILISFVYYWLVRRWRSCPVKRFIILASDRTGGTLLVDLLNSHPLINCDGEILERNKRLFLSAFLAGKSVLQRKKGVYGLRVKIKQLVDNQKVRDVKPFLTGLHKMDWKIIYLKRRNLLRQSISCFVARYRGGYERYVSDPSEKIELRLDCGALLREMERQESFSQAKEKALVGLPHLVVVYEEDLLDQEKHQAAADRIFDYLGIPRVPVRTNLAKVTPERLSDFIENYDEIVKALGDAGYARFLRDVNSEDPERL